MKAGMLALLVTTTLAGAMLGAQQPAAATDVRAACLDYVQDTLGRGVKPQDMQAWNAVTVNGTWLVEANYFDRSTRGTLWCFFVETHTGFRRISIHNRYMDALGAPLL